MNGRFHNERKGSLLIELIVSLAIVALVSLAIYSFGVNVIGLSRKLSAEMSAQQQINTTLREFEREARTMRISEGGAYPIQEASSTSFTFFSDIDKDGIVDRVRYFYSTTSKALMKGVIKPTGTIYNNANEIFATKIANISTTATTAPIFTYYDSSYDGVGTTTPLAFPVNIPSIRHIRILLIVIPGETTVKATTSVVFTTHVTPRNLKDNF